jgi:hypothetical protein
MCLYIQEGPLVAKKDLYTLKLAESPTSKTFFTFYQNFQMRLGRTYTTKIRVVDGKSEYSTRITEGFHSLRATELKKADHWLAIDFDGVWYSKCLVLCRIPKGSTYYLGTRSNVVSDMLEPLEFLLCNNISRVQLEQFLPVANLAEDKHLWLPHLFKVCRSEGIHLF